jgi:hypothetical protein
MQEHEQMLLEWLEFETPAQQRRFLEQHLILLDSQSDQLLTALEDAPEAPFRWTFLQQNLEILQDGRKRGGDMQAIRAAYVNRHAGFVLDLPDWLKGLAEEIEASDEYAFLKEQLLGALARAQDELAPEILAELSYWAAQACWEQANAEETPRLLAEALSYVKVAGHTYTCDLYPYQFAKVAYLTGRIHQQISSTSKRPGFHIQQALTFYEEAATIWTREAFAASWVLLQTRYIDALLDRYQYNGQESDLARARSLAHELLFSNLPDVFETLLITISLVRVCIVRWFRSQDYEELEHGLSLASIARDFALSAEHRAEYRAECSSSSEPVGNVSRRSLHPDPREGKPGTIYPGP